MVSSSGHHLTTFGMPSTLGVEREIHDAPRAASRHTLCYGLSCFAWLVFSCHFASTRPTTILLVFVSVHGP